MKQSKFRETEIGKIPESWEIKSISDVSEIYLGGTPMTTVKEYWDGDIKWASAKDVASCSSRYIHETERKITQKGVENSAAKILPKNTLVITSRGTVGKIALLPEPMSFNQTCYGLKARKEVSPLYLYYKLKDSVARFESVSYGTVFETITIRTFEELKISIPAFSEQLNIIKILSDLDSKIELNNEMNKTLEAIGQALFKHWFVDFEFSNEKGKPYKSSGGEMVDSELGEIPKGWSVREIKDCGEVVCGKTPSTRQKDNYGDDIAFITIPDMRNQIFVVTTGRKLSHVGAKSQKKKELPPLSVCVSCIATPGLVSLTYKRSHTNQQINSILCNENIDPYLMYYFMVNKSDQIKTMGLGGTATLNLNTGDFSKIKVIVPAKIDMLGFGKLIHPIFDGILGNVEESLNLSKICDSLLPRLMSGRIRVKDLTKKLNG